MINQNNVLQLLPHYSSPIYYLLHLRRDIFLYKRFFRSIYQRLSRGWSNDNTWNLDSFLVTIISDSLDHLAKHSISCPPDYTPEGWSDKLSSLAAEIRLYNEKDDLTASKEDQARWKEIKSRFSKAMRELITIWPDLWD